MFCGPSTVDEHRQSLVHKTYCFPRSQSISVNCLLVCFFFKMAANESRFDVLYFCLS